MPSLTKLLLPLLFLIISSPLSLGLTNPSVSAHYRLRTKSADKRFNNLYLIAYHTGAGFNDATFVSNKTQAVQGYLNSTVNGTYQQFDLKTPTIPWGMQMGGNTYYAGWLPVQINVGYGNTGFFLNSSGLQWGPSIDTGFGGWLVCNWYHGVPQLFWKDFYYNDTITCNCGRTYLVVEKV